MKLGEIVKYRAPYGANRDKVIAYVNENPGCDNYEVAKALFNSISDIGAGTLSNATKKRHIGRIRQDGKYRYYPVNHKSVMEKPVEEEPNSREEQDVTVGEKPAKDPHDPASY